MQAVHLIKEISDSANFLAKRSNYDDQRDGAIALRKSLAVAMASSVNNLQSIVPSDADQLASALAGSPYGEFTSIVFAAVDSRVAFAATKTYKKASKTTPQLITAGHAFFSRKRTFRFVEIKR